MTPIGPANECAFQQRYCPGGAKRVACWTTGAGDFATISAEGQKYGSGEHRRIFITESYL